MKYVQIKARIALYIIIIIMLTTLIFKCIYEKQQHDVAHNSKRRYSVEAKQFKQQTHKEKTIETETDREVDTQAVEPVSLGEFKLTAYCPCEICCGIWANNRLNGIVYGAIGEELKEGYSIAVDPKVIPYRTEVVINGQTYKAQDCGGGIKGNEIDVYFEDHDRALDFGVQYAEVFIKM